MIRIRIKNEILFKRFLIELISLGFKIYLNNKNADCFYYRPNERFCEISHWTDDNPIIDVDLENIEWYIDTLTGF